MLVAVAAWYQCCESLFNELANTVIMLLPAGGRCNIRLVFISTSSCWSLSAYLSNNMLYVVLPGEHTMYTPDLSTDSDNFPARTQFQRYRWCSWAYSDELRCVCGEGRGVVDLPFKASEICDAKVLFKSTCTGYQQRVFQHACVFMYNERFKSWLPNRAETFR